MKKPRNFFNYLIRQVIFPIITSILLLLFLVAGIVCLSYIDTQIIGYSLIGIAIFLAIIVFFGVGISLSRINKEVIYNISSVETQINKFKEHLCSINFIDSDVPELKNLESSANDMIRVYSRYRVMLDPRISFKHFTIDSDYKTIVSNDRFLTIIYPAIDFTSSFKSAIMIVELVGKEVTEDSQKAFHKKVNEIFGQCIVGKKAARRLEVYIPSVSTYTGLRVLASKLVKEYSYLNIRDIAEESSVVSCRVGIAVFPNSPAIKLIDDAENALESTEDVNLYVPDEAYVTRSVITESNQNKFYLDLVAKFKKESSQITDLRNLYSYLLQNVKWFANTFKYESAGTITSVFDKYVLKDEINTGASSGFFAKINDLDQEFFKRIDEICLTEEFYYAENLESVPDELHPMLDNLNIKSFYFCPIVLHGKSVGFIYFVSSKEQAPFTIDNINLMCLFALLYRQILIDYFFAYKMMYFEDIVESLASKFATPFYCINRKTYELVSYSKELKRLFPSLDLKIGQVCYKQFNKDQKAPCPNCPLVKGSAQAFIGGAVNKEMRLSVLSYAAFSTASGENATILLEDPEQNDSLSLEKNALLDNVLLIKNDKAFVLDFSRIIKAGQEGYVITATFDKAEDYADENIVSLNAVLDIMSKKMLKAGYGDVIYRYSLDTFAFILRSYSRIKAIEFVEEIASELTEVIELEGKTIKPEFFFSASAYPLRISASTQLSKVLKESIAKSRSYGPGYLVFSGGKLARKALREEYIKGVFYDAVKNEKLDINLQPIISVATGKVIGAEALLRLYGEENEYIPPSEFIPVAVQNKMLLDAEKQVLRSIGELNDVHGFGVFKAVGLEYISINISRETLEDPRLSFHIKSLFARYKFQKDFIHFEFSETIVRECGDRIKDLYAEIGGLGVVFAVDNVVLDNLEMDLLKSVSISVIKINRSVINDASTNPNAVIAMSRFISQAMGNNFTVTVEGVENANQLNITKDMDVKFVQGYLFSKPLSKEDFIKFLTFKNKF